MKDKTVIGYLEVEKANGGGKGRGNQEKQKKGEKRKRGFQALGDAT